MELVKSQCEKDKDTAVQSAVATANKEWQEKLDDALKQGIFSLLVSILYSHFSLKSTLDLKLFFNL